MKVSVLLLTFNEERNLPRCLASLDWCDKVRLLLLQRNSKLRWMLLQC